jgi:hypothetical protein
VERCCIIVMMKIELKVDHLHEPSNFISTVDKHKATLCILVFGVPLMLSFLCGTLYWLLR